jgi:uncharacterized protein with NRDE domain
MSVHASGPCGTLCSDMIQIVGAITLCMLHLPPDVELVQGEQYGTKSQTILAVTRAGQVEWHERTRPPGATEQAEWQEDTFRFQLESEAHPGA